MPLKDVILAALRERGPMSRPEIEAYAADAGYEEASVNAELYRMKAHGTVEHLSHGKHQSLYDAADGAESETSRLVAQYSRDGELIATYQSTLAAEHLTGVANSNISSVCNGHRHTAGGYVWEYVSDPYNGDDGR